jgi:photosystem II stability/assembly factor-like uncharacterized protein
MTDPAFDHARDVSMSLRRRGLALAMAALLVAPRAWSGTYVDVLDAPAHKSALAGQRLLNGAAVAGDRVVVVGQRGHILYSDDHGGTWKQASVPVSVDLVAVHFPTARKGWAVGHSGVVLATDDAGATWVKQLDGRSAAQAMVEYYEKQAVDAALRDEAARFADEGPDKPFLDVWFDDENVGYIVGAFNLVFRTDDGGRHWAPWFDRTDNPKRFHLYAVRRVGEDLYAAGEQGLVLKLDPKAQRFRAVPTPYEGTYFGITGRPGSVIVFGLRGNAYRTTDGGASWRKADTGIPVGLTAGALMPDGRIVLVSQAGHVLVSSDSGATFAPVASARPAPGAAVVAVGAGGIVVAGPRGVQASPLP